MNARERTVGAESLSYDELVVFASETPPRALLTITFRRGHSDRPQGTLVSGEGVRGRGGMIFDVTDTGAA